jgi:uncharacterized protein YjbI with pentapeptide repeats
MKPLTLVAAAAIALAVIFIVAEKAAAQNAAQIEHSRDGASCPRCNLFQADFANLELKDRNFAGARLRQADFSAAVMNHTTFAGGDLRDLNAYGAVLSGASFAGANLTNASFVGAYLEGANFRGATLDGVNFSGAEMARAVGLTQGQLDRACGDAATTLPRGLRLRACD